VDVAVYVWINGVYRYANLIKLFYSESRMASIESIEVMGGYTVIG